ncbi:MAG: hypothetical protein WD078_06800, partial [Woeseia sp.]
VAPLRRTWVVPLGRSVTHLQWTLEICLFALLMWPRAKTNRTGQALNSLFPAALEVERLFAAQRDTMELTALAMGQP